MGRVIVGENKLCVKGIVNRELAFDEIKGYRYYKQNLIKYIFIEPKSTEHKRMQIPMFLKGQQEFELWLTQNFPNAEEVAAKEDHSQMVNDEALGTNVQERLETIDKVKKITRTLNILGIIVALWTGFWASPYLYCVLTCIAIFIACIAVYKRFGHLIKLNKETESPYPSVFMPMLFVAGALLIRGIINFTLLSHQPVWIPLLLITVVLMGMLMWKNREFTFQRKKGQDTFMVIILTCLLAAFVYGAMVGLNVELDRSQPEVYKAKVLKKEVNFDKVPTYDIRLSAWEKVPKAYDIKVPRVVFNTLDEGSNATIHLKQGAFGFDWYEVMPRTDK